MKLQYKKIKGGEIEDGLIKYSTNFGCHIQLKHHNIHTIILVTLTNLPEKIVWKYHTA